MYSKSTQLTMNNNNAIARTSVEFRETVVNMRDCGFAGRASSPRADTRGASTRIARSRRATRAARCCAATAARAFAVADARPTRTRTASTWCNRSCARAWRPRRAAGYRFCVGKRRRYPPKRRRRRPITVSTRLFDTLDREIRVFIPFFLFFVLQRQTLYRRGRFIEYFKRKETRCQFFR